MTVHYIALTYEPKIAAVRQGTVRQTIRRVGKRVYRVGDKVVLHGWEGKPYRSPWNWRTEEFTLKEVEEVILDDEGVFIPGPNIRWHWSTIYADNLARLDGIVPPLGISLQAVLSGKNGKGWQTRYWILRW
jgi:hypothetical protein